MKQPIKKGIKSGFKIAWDLLKIIIPIIFIVTFLKETVVFTYVADLLSPMMGIFGLPGEAALILIVGFFASIFAAAGIVASLTLTPVQITILGLMITISHSLPLEIGILKKLKINYVRMFFLRITTSCLVGITANLVIQWIT